MIAPIIKMDLTYPFGPTKPTPPTDVIQSIKDFTET
jgi:hypothetical protein